MQHYRYNKNLTNETKYLGYAKKDDGSADTTKAYIDNTDPQCFALDYDSLVYGVNLALAKLGNDIANIDGFEDFKTGRFAYFTITEGVLKFWYNKKLDKSTTTSKETTDATTGNVTTTTTKYEWSTRNDILFSPSFTSSLAMIFLALFLMKNNIQITKVGGE